MDMDTMDRDPHILHMTEAMQAFCAKVDESIEKEKQQLKACRKKTEFETKLAQEMKLNCELTEYLAELSKRSGELDRVCAAFASKLTIAEGDQNRLDSAKEIYQIAKDLTGIRFDFSAPPDIVKGYVMNSARKFLQPFFIETESEDSEALWSVMQCTDKENTPYPNNRNDDRVKKVL